MLIQFGKLFLRGRQDLRILRILQFFVFCDKYLDPLARLNESEHGPNTRCANFQNGSVRKELSGKLQLVEVVICTSRAVESLSIPQIDQVVLGLVKNHLLKAVDCLGVVLLAQVNIGKFEPSFRILLIHLNELVQNLDGLLLHIAVTVDRDKSLDCLLITWVILNQLEQNFLSFEYFATALIRHGEHAHRFNLFWVMGSCHI